MQADYSPDPTSPAPASHLEHCLEDSAVTEEDTGDLLHLSQGLEEVGPLPLSTKHKLSHFALGSETPRYLPSTPMTSHSQ